MKGIQHYNSARSPLTSRKEFMILSDTPTHTQELINAVMAGVPRHRLWLLVFRRMMLKADNVQNRTEMSVYEVCVPHPF